MYIFIKPDLNPNRPICNTYFVEEKKEWDDPQQFMMYIEMSDKREILPNPFSS